MRLGDLFWWVPSGASSFAMASKEEWAAVLAILLVSSILSIVSRDISDRGGISAWAMGLLKPTEAWSRSRERRRQRHRQERIDAIRARQKRRQIKRSGRRRRKR